MTPYTRIHNRFEYHLEDLDCPCCLFYRSEYKEQEHGCGSEACRFADIRAEAAAKGRVKRPRGWHRCRE